jgi:hypothetical protein
MKEPCSFLTTNNRNHKLFIRISPYQRRKQNTSILLTKNKNNTSIFKLKSLNSVKVSDVLICRKDGDSSPLTLFSYTLSHFWTLFQLLCQNTQDIRPIQFPCSTKSVTYVISTSTLGTYSVAILHRQTMFSTTMGPQIFLKCSLLFRYLDACQL